MDLPSHPPCEPLLDGGIRHDLRSDGSRRRSNAGNRLFRNSLWEKCLGMGRVALYDDGLFSGMAGPGCGTGGVLSLLAFADLWNAGLSDYHPQNGSPSESTLRAF